MVLVLIAQPHFELVQVLGLAGKPSRHNLGNMGLPLTPEHEEPR